MKNYEKYADEIKEYNGYNICTDFIEPYILKSIDEFLALVESKQKENNPDDFTYSDNIDGYRFESGEFS